MKGALIIKLNFKEEEKESKNKKFALINQNNAGSMEPTIRARSLVLTVPVCPEEVREGDIVTYTRTAVDTSGGHFRVPFTVVHRVREIRDDTFIFQGDNESEPDPSVRAEQIGYRVVWIAEGL